MDFLSRPMWLHSAKWEFQGDFLTFEEAPCVSAILDPWSTKGALATFCLGGRNTPQFSLDASASFNRASAAPTSKCQIGGLISPCSSETDIGGFKTNGVEHNRNDWWDLKCRLDERLFAVSQQYTFIGSCD